MMRFNYLFHNLHHADAFEKVKPIIHYLFITVDDENLVLRNQLRSSWLVFSLLTCRHSRALTNFHNENGHKNRTLVALFKRRSKSFESLSKYWIHISWKKPQIVVAKHDVCFCSVYYHSTQLLGGGEKKTLNVERNVEIFLYMNESKLSKFPT